MRVIAGSAKGTPLEPVPGSGTRPISDRVKEALFNILGASIEDARVLDLFAGTGSVGIEALSRGAREAVFVERASGAVRVLRGNLRRTKLESGASVTKSDVFKYLSGPSQPFDLIYVAPPQYIGLWRKTLSTLDENRGWLSPGGVVVVQIFPKELEPLQLQALTLVDQRKYGSTLLCFYELAGAAA